MSGHILDYHRKERAPASSTFQIDDWISAGMGDWLETGAAFGGNVHGVLKAHTSRAFEPAIWLRVAWLRKKFPSIRATRIGL